MRVPSVMLSAPKSGVLILQLMHGMWGFPKIRGYLFGDPHNKDYTILRSILGSPYVGKLPCVAKLQLENVKLVLGCVPMKHAG